MLTEPVAFPAGLDADEPHLGALQKRGKEAQCVAAASDAGDRQVGPGAPGLLLELADRLLTDHSMEVPHHARIRLRAEDGAQHVVGVADVGLPVTQCFVDGVLQRSAAAVDGDDLGAEQPHAVDVRPLAAHVLLAHVDRAAPAQQRRGRRRRHAVLPRPGLGDDPLLPHLARQQRLPESVVELVRPRVEQILALEVDPGASQPVAHAAGVVERRRPSRVVGQKIAELAPKSTPPAETVVGPRQLGQRRHQRLGDVAAAEVAEVARAPLVSHHAPPPPDARPPSDP